MLWGQLANSLHQCFPSSYNLQFNCYSWSCMKTYYILYIFCSDVTRTFFFFFYHQNILWLACTGTKINSASTTTTDNWTTNNSCIIIIHTLITVPATPCSMLLLQRWICKAGKCRSVQFMVVLNHALASTATGPQTPSHLQQQPKLSLDLFQNRKKMLKN